MRPQDYPIAVLGLLLVEVACGRIGYDPIWGGSESNAGAGSVGGNSAAAGVGIGRGGGGIAANIGSGSNGGARQTAGGSNEGQGGALVGAGGNGGFANGNGVSASSMIGGMSSTDIASGGVQVGVGGVTSPGDAQGGSTAAGSGGVAAFSNAGGRATELGGSGGTGGVAVSSSTVGVAGAAPCVSTTEVCDGIDNDCNGIRDDVSSLVQLCPATSACVEGICQPIDTICVGYQWSNHAYALCEPTVVVEFATAQDACVAMGGHILTISSAEEDAAMRSLTTKKRDIWIGLTRGADCQWQWVTGEPTSYLGWSSGYPDGACGTFDCCMLWGQYSGIWDDTRCTSGRNYVCEWEHR